MQKATVKYYLLLIFLYANPMFAQEEAANWYFGENAGISFDLLTGNVSTLTDGQLITVEGCTSISDAAGNLVLYTDGTTLYDASHNVMENGNGLLGDESSTQSAITIPKPDDPNIYYVFTVGSNSNPTGLNYYTIDLSFNGGLGKVVGNHTNLLSGSSEKISAVLKDCISGSIWVLALSNPMGNDTNNLNTFHAFEVSNAGVNTNAVTSTLNITVTDLAGNLKFAPNGTKLACANGNSGLFIADFDANTGIVSNPEFLATQTLGDSPYGVEFSPNSQLLYTTTSTVFTNPNDPNAPPIYTSYLLQYNLFAADISASRTLINQSGNYRSSLQLGPNGKIYRSLSESYDIGIPFLSVIANPNTIGTGCTYQNQIISLNGGLSRQGLPPFIQSFFTQQVDIIQNGTDTLNLTLCTGDTYTLAAEDIPGATYIWSQDGMILPETDFDLEISQPGIYDVEIDANSGNCSSFNGQAIVVYSGIPEAFDASLFQCDLYSFSTFNLTEADEVLTGNNADLSTHFFLSQNDAENDNSELNGLSYNNISNPQIIYVKVTNNLTNCSDYSELTIGISTTQVPNYVAPIVCDEEDSQDGINTFDLNDFSSQILNPLPVGLDITYYETINDALLEQNAISSPYTNTTPYSQTLFSRIENNNTCYGINEVLLTISPLPQLDNDSIEYYCLNNFPQQVIISGGTISSATNYTYSWSTGENTIDIQVNTIDSYTFTVTNTNGCSSSRIITLEASNIATISDILVTEGSSQNNTITILTSGEGLYQYALTNALGESTVFQESNVFTSIPAGIYTVTIRDIKNNCGLIDTFVSVIGFPKYFTPNGDTVNDTWQVKGLSSSFQPNSIIYIYDRYGKLITQIKASSRGWDGTQNGVPLPTSDYWFSVTLEDGRLFTDHFTLKR